MLTSTERIYYAQHVSDRILTINEIKFGILNFGHCDLPFDLAQGGGESLDFAQDREPVERFVEPFGICNLLFEIF